MRKTYVWKVGGEAGFGIMTIGQVFSKIASRVGYHVFDYVEYPSLIRGGHNTIEVVLSDQPVGSVRKKIDFLLCLNHQTYDLHKSRLDKDSIVMFDEENSHLNDVDNVKFQLPMKKILEEQGAPAIMMNNIAIGASIAVAGWDFSYLEDVIVSTFSAKGEEIVEKNKQVARRGYDYVLEHYGQEIPKVFKIEKRNEKAVLSGNDSFALSAISSDCRFYCAYPMTPSSSVLQTLAEFARETKMVVRHAEDEISVANTALGASWAGVRSAIGTSGGGFALMVETVALSGITEIPIVIFIASRPGPATGMPTWTEQGDLLFAVSSGHGEFPKIVLAPGDIDEMFELGKKAFDLADIYQTPVIILSDKFLSESHMSVDRDNMLKIAHEQRPDRGKIIGHTDDAPYLRYKVTDDGISPMLIPGQEGIFYQSNSYEHLEDGHTTEEASERIAQADKRFRKRDTYLKNHFQAPEVYGNLEEAEFAFVSWGSNKRTILEAMEMLEEKGKKAAYIHFTHVYPIDEKKVRETFIEGKRYILVENNKTGQFGKLLRQEAGINLTERLLKYNGRPFWPEEIVDFINKTNDH